MKLTCGSRSLDLSQPVVMGVLNVTPDSFFDGGRYFSIDTAVAHAQAMVTEGAAIIDIGGESTRPGALPVSVEDECQRVVPVINALMLVGLDAVISIDTSKPEVMRQAVAAGASMINDVCALQQPGAMEAAAESDAAICLMHMQGEPQKMQDDPRYKNITEEIAVFLHQRVEACEQAGISRDRIALDPGFGFGKTVEQNYTLLRQLNVFIEQGLPVLVGLSRKSMIGAVLDVDVDQRLHGSLAAMTIAVMAGASIVRTHDVCATAEALAVCSAVMSA
ncbi:MAG TPA: dihydropteroate synthase [Gammaproteobacteria bacterium]|nr:dihydropteroate synthase [Gammaproteobacteria bacterium]